MNKLGSELMVTVTSSENASRRFSKVVKDPGRGRILIYDQNLSMAR